MITLFQNRHDPLQCIIIVSVLSDTVYVGDNCKLIKIKLFKIKILLYGDGFNTNLLQTYNDQRHFMQFESIFSLCQCAYATTIFTACEGTQHLHIQWATYCCLESNLEIFYRYMSMETHLSRQGFIGCLVKLERYVKSLVQCNLGVLLFDLPCLDIDKYNS